MDEIERLLREKRHEILRIAARHRARNVRVFGSIARGDARPDSDIDLLVEFAPESDLFDQIALKRDVEELLQRKVDVVGDDSIYWLLHRRILKEAKQL
ncbi:MAG TPA: nucleotidyltransferase family protein [Candidatus Latescibacteria bacterium]|jgi:hypothetical protein|nr:nucleotidyltransferase family protein [Candidatus Latescibacterota bacterium]HOS65765.1 nucleotidyltransferase family protein [Candidatus Latescibacterota bacterium]HOT35311.1 nucleotidyltransferase family protein [Candidatus Latescibacterota bacterium]HPK74697.1 nucleotidyltransferase family protein [Candidatus Latescibacterota bacterium]HQK23060.1 nucleotidyltransferase family protein [Candidatus Latescibacterota bacterium]